MTGAEIMYAVGFIVGLLSFALCVWKYIDSKFVTLRSETSTEVSVTRAKIDMVNAQLHEHKLDVAQNYVTKAGMTEQTQQILKGIEGLGVRIQSLNDRLDRFYESKPARRPPS